MIDSEQFFVSSAVLGLDPQNKKARYRLAQALRGLGQISDAYIEVTSLREKHSQVYVWLCTEIIIVSCQSISAFIILLTVSVGNLKLILCSDWLPEQARLKIAHFVPAQESKLPRATLPKILIFLDNVGDGVTIKAVDDRW